MINMMKVLRPIVAAIFLAFLIVPAAMSDTGTDVDAQLKALQAKFERYQQEMRDIQLELGALKAQLAAQNQESKEKDVKISKLEEKVQPWFDKGFKDGVFSAQDAVGLNEESFLNIGGELKMRYRHNMNRPGDSPGFQFYELELFIDAVISDYSSVYVEYNLMHANQPDPEDVWMDFHLSPDKAAFAGGTGVKIGNVHYPFGWDNDDNEGFVYGGRSTVNVPLVRSERIDGWRIRERQIGVVGNYNFDLQDVNVTLTSSIFNGNGSWLNYGGSDNDNLFDTAERMEFKFADLTVGTSYLYAPRTVRGVTANANNTQHIRDIHRWGVHFKYPDVPFPGQDISLGGTKWMVWGEYIGGLNKSSGITAASSRTQRTQGGYLEFDYSLIDGKLLAFMRGDLYDPDTGRKNDTIFAATPGVKWSFLKSSAFVAEYELYTGGENAASGVVKDNRITLEIQTMF